MNIKSIYKNKLYVSSRINTYEDLVADLGNKIPYLLSLTTWYHNDEGEEIKVTNTQQLLTINPAITVLILDVVEDEKQKEEDQKKLEKAEEINQKLRQNQIAKLVETIEREKISIGLLQSELDKSNNLKDTQIEMLQNNIQAYQCFLDLQLSPFDELLKDVEDFIRKKEKDILRLQGRKDYNGDVKNMAQTIQEYFNKQYASRIEQMQKYNTEYKYNQQDLKRFETSLEEQKQQQAKNAESINKRIANIKNRIQKHEQELEKLQAQK